MILLLVCTISCAVLSLVGGIIFYLKDSIARKAQAMAMPFAAGTLLASAFFDLLPEAMEEAGDVGAAMLWALCGFLVFFLLDCFFFALDSGRGEDGEACRRRSTAKLMIVGDSVHTLLDGIVIGVSFLVSPVTGLVATIAILSHEIPQEIGDFAILLLGGIEKKRVVIIQFAITLLLIPTALIAYLAGENMAEGLYTVPALAGGFFTYIAAGKIIPTLFQGETKYLTVGRSVLLLFAGIGVIALILELFSHSH